MQTCSTVVAQKKYQIIGRGIIHTRGVADALPTIVAGAAADDDVVVCEPFFVGMDDRLLGGNSSSASSWFFGRPPPATASFGRPPVPAGMNLGGLFGRRGRH
jgi:hypothetical protein